VKAIVFVGPSLPVGDARARLDAIYRSPAAMGDVYAATLERPDAIAIIDGYFDGTPAVWHKEILHALSRGVRVLGASSMGALRAAELAAFGMVGVGQIFERYCDGTYEDDDEVAIVHAAAEYGYRTLSDPLANIRDGLERAVAATAIAAADADMLIGVLKRLHYAERSWARVVAEARARGLDTRGLESFLRDVRPDRKREDACALLDRMAAGLEAPSSPPPFRFEPTTFWERAAMQARPAPDTGIGPPHVLASYVRAFRDDVARGAVLLRLARAEAQRRGLRVDRTSWNRAARQLRRRLGLLSAPDLEGWLARQRMSRRDYAELVELEALVDRLAYETVTADAVAMTRELQRRGELDAVGGMLADKWRRLEERGQQNPTLADTRADLRELLGWYETRAGTSIEDYEAHAHSRGFETERDLMIEVLTQFIYEREEPQP
jgi:hypothetical protein